MPRQQWSRPEQVSAERLSRLNRVQGLELNMSSTGAVSLADLYRLVQPHLQQQLLSRCMASPLVDPLASAHLEARLVKTYRERGSGLLPSALRQGLAGGNGPPAATQVAAR